MSSHDLLQLPLPPPPYITPPPLGSMCFGVKATTSLCSRCLRRTLKLLTDSAMYSHLTVLDNHAAAHANTPAFKLPHISTHGGSSPPVEAWIPINYRRFRDDVEHFARYWITTLQRAGIAPRSRVGIWWVSTSHTRRIVGYITPSFLLRLSFLPLVADSDSPLFPYTCVIRIDGTTYQDVLHILGVSRAGYIPQLFHFHHGSSANLIIELLRRANSLALICDVSHAQPNRDSSSPFASLPIPVYTKSDVRQAGVPSHCRLPKIEDLVADPNAVAFVLHTAGTTMGTPQIVPYNYRTVDSIIRRAQIIATPTSSRRQDTYVLK